MAGPDGVVDLRDANGNNASICHRCRAEATAGLVQPPIHVSIPISGSILKQYLHLAAEPFFTRPEMERNRAFGTAGEGKAISFGRGLHVLKNSTMFDQHQNRSEPEG